jgi:hypothetical protein
VPTPWSADQVLALAPDTSSATAGRKLAAPGPWTSTGTSESPAALWGLCAGSGKTPYKTVIDLAAPAYQCSCPSRKFPCKHALGLLLLWSSGHVPATETVEGFAQTWLSAREARAAKASEPRAATASDPAAAARRAQQRAGRVTDGVEELERWLLDQVRTGLAGADRAGYGHVDAVAARLVDAQAPTLASAVRGLAGVAASGEGWPARLLDELALLHLLAVAHRGIDALPDELAATVRTRVGYPTKVEDVLGREPLRDRWDVLALHDQADGRLRVRRAHLRGAETGRSLVQVSFGAGGQPLDASLVPGTCIDADVHVYPGSPTRGVVGTRHATSGALDGAPGTTVTQAVAERARVLALDPWTTEVPVLLDAVTPVRADGGSPAGWALVDAAGDALPLQPSSGIWTLLACSGGAPVRVVGELTSAGVLACGVLGDEGLVTW